MLLTVLVLKYVSVSLCVCMSVTERDDRINQILRGKLALT